MRIHYNYFSSVLLNNSFPWLTDYEIERNALITMLSTSAVSISFKFIKKQLLKEIRSPGKNSKVLKLGKVDFTQTLNAQRLFLCSDLDRGAELLLTYLSPDAKNEKC